MLLDGDIVPFEVKVSEDALTDLRSRLSHRRPPSKLMEPDAWRDGTNAAALEELLAYWETEFDWRAQERQLNSLKHFKIDDLHFVHQRSEDPNAIPLLLVHGWPGSIVEFMDIIPKLTQGPQPFHVVAPSLPGFAWSRSLADQGGKWGTRSTAKLFKDLMARLGYSQFVAQGGDWGAVVAHWAAADFPESCVAVHQNMPTVGADCWKSMFSVHGIKRALVTKIVRAMPQSVLDASDQNKVRRQRMYLGSGLSYFLLHNTKPQQIGVALQDSPVALASWILEKIHGWTDFDLARGVYSGLSKDQILCNLSVYWFTECISSSCRFYFETTPMIAGVRQEVTIPGEYCDTPLGCSTFSKEVLAHPRPLVALAWNLKQWKVHEKGGHFPAWEVPDVLAKDIKEFFYDVVDFETCKKEARGRFPASLTASGASNFVLGAKIGAIIGSIAFAMSRV